MLWNKLISATAAAAGPTVIAVVQSGQNNAPNNFTITFSQTATSGNALFFLVRIGSGNTSTTPSGWTLYGNFISSSSPRLVVYTKNSDGTETSVSASTNASGASGVFFELENADLSTLINSAASSATNTSPDASSVSPGGTTNKMFLAAFAGSSDLTSVTAPTGMTMINNSTRVGVAELVGTDSSYDPGAFTISPSQTWVAVNFSITEL